MKAYIRPWGSEIDPGTGIGRVCIAQQKYLPDYDIRVIDDWKDADVTALHTQSFGVPNISVLHCHGLYWSGDTGSGNYLGWNNEANKRIIDAARKAREITVPSDWVAEPFRRDMRLEPHIIGHGIDLDEWQPGVNGGYILWNKNRPGDVCDPTPPYELAKRGLSVRSTFAPDKPKPEMLTVTGRLPFQLMQEQIRNADVYLATTKETFGIGTIEAMACGVPVLGWRWAGTADIVTHQVDGWLCEPHDYDGLVEGYYWIQDHRQELSAAAMETAKRYTWKEIIGKYAEVYRKATEPEPSGVAVIIPCYNYAKYVWQAIESALNQTRKPEEIIVIDDGSTDGSLDVIARYNGAIKVVHQQNKGVAAARNIGISMTRQPFITCLDADDRMHPRFIEMLRNKLVEDRGVGIAYGGIGMLLDDEMVPRPYDPWPPPFTWKQQTEVHNPPANCVPSANMFRRSMWERAGGFRQQYAPGEDTEFWTRGLSVGYNAVKVTTYPLFEYRIHQNSASRTKKYCYINTWLPWLNDRQFPFAAPSEDLPVVRSYSEPIISVIIPVAPEHLRYLPVAVESVLGQSFRDWEIIAVLDMDEKPAEYDSIMRPYPFVKVRVTGGERGAGVARNMGLKAAKAPMVLWLDADDYIMPNALSEMLAVWTKSGGRFIYTDWTTDKNEGHLSSEYGEQLYQQSLFHPITVLMTKEQAQMVKGFDENLATWEDWDFFIKCAVKGIHGRRLEGYYLHYRTDTGLRRKTVMESEAEQKRLRSKIIGRYRPYFTGAKDMAGCCGGHKAAEKLLRARNVFEPQAREGDAKVSDGTVRIEYFGPRTGAVTYIGKSGKRYQFGNNTVNRYQDVDAMDLRAFIGMEGFRIVEKPPVPEKVSPPIQVKEPEAKAPEAQAQAVMEIAQPEPESAVSAAVKTPEVAKKRATRRRVSKK